MGKGKEDGFSLGYSFIKNLDREIQTTLETARSRSLIAWGKAPAYNSLNLNIRIDNDEEPLDSEKIAPFDIMQKALHIRSAVEWTGWNQATAFPAVRQHAAPGEPLGQCLVTARFGKDYFQNAKLAEVRVKQKTGEVVGPHIILVLPSEEYGEMALDLTPDQALAMGTVPRAVRDMNPHLKVNLIPLSHPENPYEIVMYQTDEELATKRSKPLEHTRLLKELVAFASGHPEASRLEKYASRLPIKDLSLNSIPESASLLKLLQKYDRDSFDFQVQTGIIEQKELEPDPVWLWETLGLAGYRNARMHDRGFIQELLFSANDKIYILNLVGGAPINVLEELENMMQTPQTRVLPGKPLLKDHVELRKWSGPIFVDPKL